MSNEERRETEGEKREGASRGDGMVVVVMVNCARGIAVVRQQWEVVDRRE